MTDTGTREKDGREWQIGGATEVAWIDEGRESGVRITSAIPPIFEAYATILQPGWVEKDEGQVRSSRATSDQIQRHELAILALLTSHSAPQPWWLGFLETGEENVVFTDAPTVNLYAGWPYVLVEAGPEQARTWRDHGHNGALPDLMFPADHSWLLSNLWDDCWAYVGGPRDLVDDLLAHPDLGTLAREVDPSMPDATPPGFTAY